MFFPFFIPIKLSHLIRRWKNPIYDVFKSSLFSLPCCGFKLIYAEHAA